MNTIKRYTDPTFSTVGIKNSKIVYPVNKLGRGGKTGGQKFTEQQNKAEEDFANKALVDYRVNSDQASTAASRLGDIKLSTFNPANINIKLPEETKEKADLSGLTNLVPYASNIINGFRKLPKPIASQLESPVDANLVNLDAARNQIDADQRNANKETDYRITNPGVAQAIKAVYAGKAIEGRNSLAMNEANQNAQIKNQTNQFNQGVTARNIGRRDIFNDKLVGRQIQQQNLRSENLADIGDKYQLSERDRALMSLEERKLSYLPEFYEKDASGTSPYDRFKSRNSNVEKEGQKSRYGGKIKRFN